jgi:two-component sensor histidine kinase
MKQKKLLMAGVFTLLWLPQLLFAQKGNAFSKMKPGDWFDVSTKLYANPNVPEGQPEFRRYDIKYKLKNVQANGGSNYKVLVERSRIKSLSSGNIWMGYDSYYPSYLQASEETLGKPGFELQIAKDGKIASLKASGSNQISILYPIQVQRTVNGILSSTTPAVDTGFVKLLSEAIIRNTASTAEFSYQLSAASFPIEKNALVRGKISNMNDIVRKKISLYAAGLKEEAVFEKDGTFSLSLLLNGGRDVSFTYETASKSLNVSLFVEPGDTLVIDADGKNFEPSIRFSGKAAKIADLAMELAIISKTQRTPELSYGTVNFSLDDFIKQQQRDKASFNLVLSKYKSQVPAEGWTYYYHKFIYGQAKAKLDFLLKTKYRSSPQSDEIFEGFPKDFFNSIDTLPILMNDYTDNYWYTSFIHDYGLYISDKVARVNGGQYGFLARYAMSLTYLRRFPLYFSLSEAFEQELAESNWEQAQHLKPYYEDFIRNCGDTALTNLVKQKWTVINGWATGNTSPLKQLKLADGSTLDLNKFKGKALSLTFNFHYPDKLKDLVERIKKQNPKKVHFVIVQLAEKQFPKSTIDSALKHLPNVTYVEVKRDDALRNQQILLKYFDIKTFIFSPELKVIEDNIDEINHYEAEGKFDSAIKAAHAPHEMSKEDKAELIKTIGWSAGSILVAFLIFLWIYKIRVGNLKRKESIKRQINELEIKAIRSQMNPHFLFNALNSIQSLINNNQYKEANFYLEKFSLLMRRVLNNSEKIFITLSDEMEAVGLYAELEKLRFNFSFNIHIEENVNADLIEIPGMIIQPLVENAIVHGLAQRGTIGKLEIHIRKEQSYLNITVKDNGRGLSTKAETHNGFGLKLVKERLNLLNANGINGKLTLSSNLVENSTGVTAELIIPID